MEQADQQLQDESHVGQEITYIHLSPRVYFRSDPGSLVNVKDMAYTINRTLCSKSTHCSKLFALPS